MTKTGIMPRLVAGLRAGKLSTQPVACPWCVRNFRDALAEEGDDYPVYDVVQLLLGEV